jgi:D-alanine-D-alanine ligase
VSLKSGAQVLANLSKEKYTAELVEISAEGTWLVRGPEGSKYFNPPTAPTPYEDRPWDVVFIALHGTFGEDGRVQALLDLAGIPYTGSGVLASAIGMDKTKTRKLAAGVGVRSPGFLEFHDPAVSSVEVSAQIVAGFGYPCVVKPNASGSSIGVSIVRESGALPEALQKAFKEDQHIVVEEYIKGTETSCGVLGNTFQTELLPLPPVEIIPDGEFFDYQAKYQSAATQEICPARFGDELNLTIQNLAMRVHEALGCDGLTRSDFIVKNGVPYFLEINTIPGLTEQSLCPKEARALGMEFGVFLDKIVELALKKKK